MALFGPPNIEKLKEKRDVNGLIKALSHKDAQIRYEATQALGVLGNAQAVEPLIAALKDENRDIRQTVAWWLGELGDVRTLEPLIAALRQTSDMGLRKMAAEALGKLGEPAVEPLIAALKDEDAVVRSEAAEALGKLDDLRAVEPLSTFVRDQNSRLQLSPAAVGALRTMFVGSLDRIPFLDTHTCRMAVEALGQLGAIEALIDALQRRDNFLVRANAAEVLGWCGDRSAVEPLMAALRDTAEVVRMEAAGALGRLGDIRAVEPLVASLRDEVTDVWVAAAIALGKLGDARAVQPLIDALKDEDFEVQGEEESAEVRQAAAEILERIGGPEAEQALAEYRARQK